MPFVVILLYASITHLRTSHENYRTCMKHPLSRTLLGLPKNKRTPFSSLLGQHTGAALMDQANQRLPLTPRRVAFEGRVDLAGIGNCVIRSSRTCISWKTTNDIPPLSTPPPKAVTYTASTLEGYVTNAAWSKYSLVASPARLRASNDASVVRIVKLWFVGCL